MKDKRVILITGGQRSGKSQYAEKLALSLSEHPVYLATAHIWDDEFRKRVEIHQRRRGANWSNIEEEKYLSRHNIYNKVVVIDCITLWCTNFFFDQGAKEFLTHFCNCTHSFPPQILFICHLARIQLLSLSLLPHK